MTMITPSYLGETIEYSSLHACRSTLEDPTGSGAGTPRRVLTALGESPSLAGRRAVVARPPAVTSRRPRP